MEYIKRLELTIAELYEAVPHLPVRGQAWLANNVWWIILVDVLLSGLGVITFVVVGLFAIVGSVLFVGPAGTAIAGLVVASAFVNLGLSIIELVFMVMAIHPLKYGQKKGWNYLFVVYLISVAAAIISFLFHFNAHGVLILILNAIGLLVIGYFLFEIRSHMLMPQRQYVNK